MAQADARTYDRDDYQCRGVDHLRTLLVYVGDALWKFTNQLQEARVQRSAGRSGGFCVIWSGLVPLGPSRFGSVIGQGDPAKHVKSAGPDESRSAPVACFSNEKRR